MNTTNNTALTPNAQLLRRNMTKEERHLWYDFLKSYPIPFHRQKVIGRFIVDFCCAKAKVIFELDGSQHYEPEGKSKDRERDSYLSDLGYLVLRYTNLEITTNFRSVCEDIDKQIASRII